MARSKSFASLKNKLESKIRKKKRVKPLKRDKISSPDEISKAQNTNGTHQPEKNDPKLKMEPRVELSKIPQSFEENMKKNKRKKKVTFIVPDQPSDLKKCSHNRKTTIIRTKTIIMSDEKKP